MGEVPLYVIAVTVGVVLGITPLSYMEDNLIHLGSHMTPILAGPKTGWFFLGSKPFLPSQSTPHQIHEHADISCEPLQGYLAHKKTPHPRTIW